MRPILLGIALGLIALSAIVWAGTSERVGLDYTSTTGPARSASGYPGLMVLKFSNAGGDTLSREIIFDPWLVGPVDSVISDSILYEPSDTLEDCDTTYLGWVTWTDTLIDCDTAGYTVDSVDTNWIVRCDTSFAYKDTLFEDSIKTVVCESTIVFTPTDTLYDTTAVFDSLHYTVRGFSFIGPLFASMYEAPLRFVYRDAAQRRDTLYWPDPTYLGGASLLCEGIPIPPSGWIPAQVETIWAECEDSLSEVRVLILYD